MGEYLKNGEVNRLLKYLSARSNLPGPRVNLELLTAFASLIRKRSPEKPGLFWKLALKLAERSRSVEKTDEPMEFALMCGLAAIAALGVPRQKSLQGSFLARCRVSEGFVPRLDNLIQERIRNA